MNRPSKFWEEFKESIYGNEPLVKSQERECSLAFYAGMLACFIEMSQISGRVPDDESGIDSGAEDMERLRIEIGVAARHANLDRSDGKS
jgi:hypothetical protein